MTDIAENIIRKCGGVKPVAKALGLSTVQVHRFKYPRERNGTGGLIPAKHQSRLLAWAACEGIDLRPADFFSGDFLQEDKA